MFRVVAGLLCVLLSLPCFGDVTLLSSKNDRKSEFYVYLDKEVKKNKSLKSNKRVAITIGQGGLVELVDSERKFDAVIATLISRTKYEEILFRFPGLRAQNLTVIYLDPSTSDLTLLAALIYPQSAKIGIPYRKGKVPPQFTLPPRIKKRTHVQLIKTSDVTDMLRNTQNLDAIVAIADPDLYTASNIAPINRKLYRQRKGLIGFSKNMVKAGAVAALYSEKEDTLIQIQQILSQFKETGILQQPSHPALLRVIVNQQLAKTLGLFSLDERELERKINQNFLGETQ